MEHDLETSWISFIMSMLFDHYNPHLDEVVAAEYCLVMCLFFALGIA